MRTADNFVDDMLSKKRHWTAILSVARVARGGSWAGKVKQILRDRKIIPETDEELNRMRDQVLMEDRKRNEKAAKQELERKHRERHK